MIQTRIYKNHLAKKIFGSVHQQASCPSKPKYATDGTQKQGDFEPFNVLIILMPSPAESPCPTSHTAGITRTYAGHVYRVNEMRLCWASVSL